MGLTPGNDHHSDEARQQQSSLAPCFSTRDHLLRKNQQQPQTFDSRTLAPPERKAAFGRGEQGAGVVWIDKGSVGEPVSCLIKALVEQLDMVLAGDLTPAAGLAAAARAWEALTDRRGRTSQRRHDREAMGLATRTGTEGKP